MLNFLTAGSSRTLVGLFVATAFSLAVVPAFGENPSFQLTLTRDIVLLNQNHFAATARRLLTPQREGELTPNCYMEVQVRGRGVFTLRAGENVTVHLAKTLVTDRESCYRQNLRALALGSGIQDDTCIDLQYRKFVNRGTVTFGANGQAAIACYSRFRMEGTYQDGELGRHTFHSYHVIADQQVDLTEELLRSIPHLLTPVETQSRLRQGSVSAGDQ